MRYDFSKKKIFFLNAKEQGDLIRIKPDDMMKSRPISTHPRWSRVATMTKIKTKAEPISWTLTIKPVDAGTLEFSCAETKGAQPASLVSVTIDSNELVTMQRMLVVYIGTVYNTPDDSSHCHLSTGGSTWATSRGRISLARTSVPPPRSPESPIMQDGSAG